MGMMVYVGWTLALCFAVMSLWFWTKVQNERLASRDAEARAEMLENRFKRVRSRLEAERDAEPEEVAQLRGLLEEVREERHREAEAYLERSSRYEKRISELVRQNQNLAERVASLRKEGLPEGGEDFHVEEAEPEEPWSEPLRQFYEGVETVEAQQAVESYIEDRRAAGIDDEQILRELREMEA